MSIQSTADSSSTVEKTPSPTDSLFVDYKPTAPKTEYFLFRTQKGGKAGWMNVDGEWVIPPDYDIDFSREWSEGILICRKEGKYGAVNYRNEIILPFELVNPPANCSNALILVANDANLKAYFSKEGIQMTEFEKSQPEFRNGLAVIRSNLSEFASYPRIDLENSNRTAQMHSGDMAVINTKFDTLLQFENVPFLLEFGALRNNRRTFFLYPNLGLHADLGISYGQYGYLDGKGDIAIEPKFRASDVFIRVRGGYVREPDCPFISNLSMVRELDEYYYIDTLGVKVFELQTDREIIFDVSNPNNCGVIGYRTFGVIPNSSMIHIADRTGTILHEAYESKAPMSVGGVIGSVIESSPRNDFIPILDRESGFLRIFNSCFEEVSSFPLEDSTRGCTYRYEGFDYLSVSEGFALIQICNTSSSSTDHVSYKRVVDHLGEARSSWFPMTAILSNAFGNYSVLDTLRMTNSLYDFGGTELFKCDSCYFDYQNDMRSFGVYKARLSTGDQVYINYTGQVLSESFDSMEEKIIDLSDQVSTYDSYQEVVMNASEEEFEQLFRESAMYGRIIK
ncbi:MAG: WG repeat-containing protein [Oceanospirillaceae bacterium]|nr:WG repeat-containing protein [Oceanospirillaceae bacterium]